MPIDPSIPLQAGQQLPRFGPDWGVIQNALKTQIAMQNQAQVQQAENALKAAYSDPNNFDPNTLALKPNAMVNLAQQAPQAAMEVRNNLLKNQEQQARAGVGQAKILEQYGEQANDIANKARRAYEEALENRVLPAQAQAIGQRVYTEELNRWLPNLPPEIASKVPKDFDVMRARATEQGWKEHQAQLTGARAARKEDRDERKEDRADRREERMSAAQEQELAVKGYVKQQDMDPDTNQPRTVWVNPDRSKPPLDLAGNPTPISGRPPPTAADQKLGKVRLIDKSVRDVREYGGRFFDRFTDEPIKPERIIPGSWTNEGATLGASEEARRAAAEQIVRYKAPPLTSYAMGRPEGAETMKYIKEIEQSEGIEYNPRRYYALKQMETDYARNTPSSLGGAINAANTVTQHLDQLSELQEALDNPRSPVAAKIVNYVRTLEGNPKPTNVKTAARFLAGEAVKLTTGAAGALADREETLKSLSGDNGREQQKGAIVQLKRLMGGRLNSMRQQWTAHNQIGDEWDAKLTDEALAAMGPYIKKREERAAKGAEKPPDEPAAPAAGTKAKGGARPANEAAIPPKPAAGGAAPQQGAIPTVKTKAERDALPPGAKYYKEGDDLNAPPRTRE